MFFIDIYPKSLIVVYNLDKDGEKMNWKKEAEYELRDYKHLISSVENLKERIASVSESITAIKCSTAASTPVQGGGTPYEDNLINKLVELERLKALLDANRRRLRIIKRGLAVLSDTEIKVLTRFYVDGIPYAKAVCCLREEIQYEEAQINRIRNKALYHYTIAEFGLPEH